LTVDLSGVQSLQAAMTVLTAAMALLGIVLLALREAHRRQQARAIPVVQRRPHELVNSDDRVSLQHSAGASLQSRAPPLIFHRACSSPPAANCRR
jgi:hypothetical protein